MINPPICASQEILLVVTAMNICEINQKIIKYLAFIVVGNNIPNGTNTNNLAFGNKYTYAPISPDTTPDAPTTVIKLF